MNNKVKAFAVIIGTVLGIVLNMVLLSPVKKEYSKNSIIMVYVQSAAVSMYIMDIITMRKMIIDMFISVIHAEIRLKFSA